MAGGVEITDAVLDEIKQRVDLGDLIASYGVDVRHAGSSLKACCPFHREKTPSFNINVNRGYYHCFGCGESGDAIKFVQKFEGLSFPEAVKKLASRCGIELKENDDPTAGRRRRLYALMAELAQFYRRCLLMTREAAPAREYLKNRFLDDETCDKWTVGYAPEGAATILKWADKYKYTAQELEEAGVILAPRRPGDSAYHRFSGRLMFTIRDRQGRVVGFSGRLLKEKKNTGKYVNSPETPIFKKSSILFGFDRASSEIARSPHHEMIACEGQIDCIRLHMCGFRTAVASQGTAFTGEHAKMLKRVADSAVLMYDDDGAGRKATIKVAGMLLEMEMPVRVVGLPDGDDPDSFLLKHEPAELQKRIDDAESIMSFQCRVERAKEPNPDSLDAISRVTKAVLSTVAKCPSPVLRAAMLDEASRLLALPRSALEDELEKAKNAPSAVAYDSRQAVRPQPGPAAPEDPDGAERQFEDVAPPEMDDSDYEVPETNAHAAVPPPAGEIALMEFLLANEYDKSLDPMVESLLPPQAFAHEFTGRFVKVWRDETASGEDGFAAFADSLDGDERRWFDEVLLGSGKTQASSLSPAEILREQIRELWRAELERRRGALPANGGDETIVRRMELTTRIKRLRQAAWSAVKEIIDAERQSST